MNAVEVDVDAPAVVRRALLEQRLVCNATGPTTIRFLPPLVIGEAEIEDCVARLGAVLARGRRLAGRLAPPMSDFQPRTASYQADPAEVRRVLLLYSGGLDTSVMLKWIQERYDAEVVTLTVNLGQPGEDYAVIEGKARRIGAVECHVVDAREEFAREYVAPAIMANALYGGGYPLFTALGRPLIAKLAVEYARRCGCDTIAHGCTGKGNDQVRIDGTIATLAPELQVIAPVREWAMGREEEIEYARRARHPGQGRHRDRPVLDRRQPLGPLVGGPLDRGARPRPRRGRLPARHAAATRARRAAAHRARVRAPACRSRSTASGSGWSS